MKKKIILGLLALILVAAGVLTAVYLPGVLETRRREQAYQDGVLLQKQGAYTEAIEKFRQVGEMEDAASRITECTYQRALKSFADGEHAEALKAFYDLHGYRDAEQYVLKCSYALGQSAYEQRDYPTAISYYLASGDYSENITQELDRCYYDYAHALFCDGKLEEAHTYFDNLTCEQEELGWRHFDAMDDAREYIMQCGLNGQEDFTIYIADAVEVPILDVRSLVYTAQAVLGEAVLDAGARSIHITVNAYPGVRIAAAWRKGELGDLSDRERETLEMALELVEQAKAETDSALALETWINDWICEHCAYDDDVSKYDLVNSIPENCTAVGVLLNGQALCQGYTDAFYLLGTMAGLDICYQVGFGGGGNVGWGGHIWNLIRFEDRWYNVDTTWNDLTDEYPTAHLYQNFLKEKDHVVMEGRETCPLAEWVAPEDDYYIVNDCDFETVAEAAEQIVARHFSEKEEWYEVRVRSADVTAKELSNEIYQVMLRKGRYGSWGVGDVQSSEATVFMVQWG